MIAALAGRSLRYRWPTFTATFVSVVLCALVMGSFALLVESAFVTGTPAADQESLLIMGSVVGGWGTLIALFSLVSALGIAVRRRGGEVSTLRLVGATPGQLRGLIRGETFWVALVAAAAGLVLAAPAGRLLLTELQEASVVSGAASAADGWWATAATLVVVLLVCLVAADVAARRVSRAASAGRRRVWPRVLGVVLVVWALALAVVTVTVTAGLDDPYAAMQTAGPACIVAAVGLATLAGLPLSRLGAGLQPALGRSAAGTLATGGARRRTGTLGGVLGPVIVFVSAAAGTLTLVDIDNRTLVIPAGMSTQAAQMVTTLNTVVVGMIALFAALMVATALTAVVGDRAAEFATLRRCGTTDGQVRATVLAESLLISAVGIVLGLVGACFTVLPFAWARDEGWIPDGGLWLAPAVAGVALLLTCAVGQVAATGALRRSRREPAPS